MGSVSFDADVLIGFLDPQDAHHARARATFAEHEGDRKIISATVVSEILVEPTRNGTQANVLRFLDRIDATIVPVDTSIAVRAAALRAEHGRALRLSDALALAVARARDVSLVTFDDRLRRLT